MLQQDPLRRIDSEKTGRTEPPPIPLTVRRYDPGVPRIARPVRTPRLAGVGRLDRHPHSLSHPTISGHARIGV